MENVSSKGFVRALGRSTYSIRPVRVTYDAFGYGSANVLFELGNTKVLCAVSLQVGVPPFLKGTKTGWLTAEYAMLPTATTTRSQRESVSLKRSGRATEISRLIGRVLRAVTCLDCIGERTISIDCDVLQADGGTRTASITGSYLALKLAEQRWLADKIITKPCLVSDLAAISVGIIEGVPLVDLDCEEDTQADADFNFVMTSAHELIEVQGAVEKCSPISWAHFDQMRDMAIKGVDDLFKAFPANIDDLLLAQNNGNQPAVKSVHEPLFCLKNRLSRVND